MADLTGGHPADNPSATGPMLADVRHVGYNPNPLYGGIGPVMDRQAAEGYVLVRVVSVDSYRHVAVFKKVEGSGLAREGTPDPGVRAVPAPRNEDDEWIADEAFRLAAENKRLTALVKDAAWQLNEALSMLQEADRDAIVRARETRYIPGWVEDFRMGLAEMQNVLTCLSNPDYFGGTQQVQP